MVTTRQLFEVLNTRLPNELSDKIIEKYMIMHNKELFNNCIDQINYLKEEHYYHRYKSTSIVSKQQIPKKYVKYLSLIHI